MNLRRTLIWKSLKFPVANILFFTLMSSVLLQFNISVSYGNRFYSWVRHYSFVYGIEITPTKEVGVNRGIGISFLVYYDTGSSGDSSCFSNSGMEHLEEVSFQNFSYSPFALGCTLCGCCILLAGNRLERTALGISLLINWLIYYPVPPAPQKLTAVQSEMVGTILLMPTSVT